MKRHALIAAGLAGLACAGASPAAHAETVTIAMPGKFFEPARATAVAGDAVLFRNTDLTTHDVRIAGGVFDSGPMARFATWSQTIDQPGAYPLVCTLHAFMSGSLDVVPATLETATTTVVTGEPVELTGRTRAGSPALMLERSTADGAWGVVGSVTPAPDGTFRASTPAVEGAAYRVNGPVGPSRAVTPRVTARLAVHLEVRRVGDRRILRAHAAPAPEGFAATLEIYSPWRYAWRPAGRRVRLDAHGRARFTVPASRRGFARVALSRAAGAPTLAHSRVVHIRTGRTARDPDGIAAPGAVVPPGGGHGGHGGH